MNFILMKIFWAPTGLGRLSVSHPAKGYWIAFLYTYDRSFLDHFNLLHGKCWYKLHFNCLGEINICQTFTCKSWGAFAKINHILKCWLFSEPRKRTNTFTCFLPYHGEKKELQCSRRTVYMREKIALASGRTFLTIQAACGIEEPVKWWGQNLRLQAWADNWGQNSKAGSAGAWNLTLWSGGSACVCICNMFFF